MEWIFVWDAFPPAVMSRCRRWRRWKPLRLDGVGDSVTCSVRSSEGEAIRNKVERAGKILEFAPVPIKQKTKAWERKGLRQIGIEPAFTPMIGEVVHGSPAERAGLKPND